MLQVRILKQNYSINIYGYSKPRDTKGQTLLPGVVPKGYGPLMHLGNRYEKGDNNIRQANLYFANI